MDISVLTVPGAFVAPSPSTKTVSFAGLSDGQVRRLVRIFNAQASNTPYNGELTTAFAVEARDALREQGLSV